MSHLLLTPFDVIMYKGKVAVVLAPTMDTSSRTRKFSDTYVDCAYVNEDGTLGNHFELDRKGYLEKGKIQLIDGARARVVVELPPDIQKQVEEYRAQEKDTAAAARYQDELHRETEYHPSYGSIRLSKISGYTKLFMSPFRHQHFIGITISRASKTRSLAADHMHGELRNVVQVFLSEAQFARFITSPMDGNGTPCTIHNVIGTYMPEPPEGDEKERFQEDVEKSAEAAAKSFQAAVDFAEALLTKPTVAKKDRETLLGYLRSAQKKIEDSMPFIVKQMRERMETVVAQAGIEVDAYLNRLAQATGMKALTGKEPPLKMLTAERKLVDRMPNVSCPSCQGTHIRLAVTGKVFCENCKTVFGPDCNCGSKVGLHALGSQDCVFEGIVTPETRP